MTGVILHRTTLQNMCCKFRKSLTGATASDSYTSVFDLPTVETSYSKYNHRDRNKYTVSF